MNTGTAMIRASIVVLATCGLSACGLADTAVTGAAGAASEAEAARQGQKTEQQVQDRVEAAQRQEAEQRRNAEAVASGGGSDGS
jgi:hypothetical protein